MKAILISFFFLFTSLAHAANSYEEQVLEVMAQTGSLLSDPIIGYSMGAEIYLPLLDMGKILGVRIEQPADRTFQVFTSETESTNYDLSSCASAFRLPICNNFVEFKGVTFASARYMRDIMNWPVDVDLKDMRVMVTTKGPGDEGLAKKMQNQKPLAIERKMWGNPSVRMEVGHSSPDNQNLVGVYATQPLLNHDSDLIYYKESGREQARYTISRQMFDEDTAPLAPRSYAIFSTQTTEMKYLFSPTQVTGFSVSNRRVDENIFDTHNLYEHGPPRWKVELFINGVYFGQTTIGLDGTFSFNDVPLFYGNNKLIYRLTSPLGQVNELVRNYDVSSEFTGANRLSYMTSYGQVVNDSSYMGSAQVSYGLSDSTSMQAGMAQFPFEEKSKSFSSVGLNFLQTNYTLSATKVTSTDSHEGYYSIMPKVNFGGVLLSTEHTEFSDLHSLLVNKSNDNQQTALSKVSALSQMQWAVPTTVQLQFEQDRFAKYDTTQEALLRAYAMLGGSSVLMETSKTWPSEAHPDFYLEIGEYLNFFRARYGVLIQDDKYAKSKIAIEANLPAEFFLTVNCETPTRLSDSSYTVGLSKLVSEVQVETTFTGAAAENSIGVILSTNIKTAGKKISLNSEESLRQGHIVLFAFIDDNGNGKFDEGEKPYSNLKIMHVQRQKHYETGLDGKVTVPAISPYQRVSLEIVRESIKSIFLTAPDFKTDYLLTPAEELVVEIPIIATFDVTGLVNNPYYKKLLPMELVDSTGKVVAQATSKSNGRYRFDDVSAGNYSVRLNHEFAEKNKLFAEPENIPVEVSGKAGIKRVPEMQIIQLGHSREH